MMTIVNWQFVGDRKYFCIPEWQCGLAKCGGHISGSYSHRAQYSTVQHSTVQYSTVTLRRFFTRLIYNDMLFIYRTFILQHLTADCLEDISADPGLGTLWEFSHYQMDSYKSPNIAGCKVYVLNLTHLKHHVSCLQTIKSEVLIE